MAKTLLLLATIATIVCVETFAIPFTPAVRSGVKKCYDYVCPEGTFSCKRHARVSKDKKDLETDISCLDLSHNELKIYREKKDNVFGPNVYYDSYAYSSVYLFDREPESLKPTNDNNKDVENIIK